MESNQCLSPLKVVSSNPAHGEIYVIQQYMSVTCMVFFLSSPVFSTNKTERQDIVEILVKVALNTITILKTYIGFEP